MNNILILYCLAIISLILSIISIMQEKRENFDTSNYFAKIGIPIIAVFISVILAIVVYHYLHNYNAPKVYH